MSEAAFPHAPACCDQEILPVAGIVPLSSLDFPGRLALTVFTQGCPWRCPYCHNAALQPRGGATAWSWERVCELLDERRGFLEAVVFSGGEPTLHPGLPVALRQVREMGFLAGLHTAGMFPRRLRRLLPLLDWVGLDVKAPFDSRYGRLTGDPESASHVRLSLERVRGSGLPFQLRTTVAAGARSEQDYADLCAELRRLDAPEPVRQVAINAL